MTFEILRQPAGVECASILAELPEWFGMPAANAAYAEAADRQPAWIARQAGEALGVMVLADPGFSALDVHLLAVRRQAHRRGVGKALVGQAEAVARTAGKAFLTVKTQGPSAGYAAYDRTRAFYDAVGFRALEEFTEIWGPENPCLLMVMALDGRPGAT